jgi:curved DNA-binding protein CbpA
VSQRTTDLYKILQVDPEADVEIIGAAYRKLAQRYHPDVAADPDAASRMAAINAAWEVLRDPEKRAAYDRERRFGPTGARPGARPPGSAGAGTSRSAGASGSPYGGRPGTSTGSRYGSSAYGGGRAAGGPTEAGGWTPGGRETYTGAGASAASGEKFRAGGAAGTGGTQDDWAGPPPGPASGSVITFGRYRGWSLGEIARHDLAFVEWLERAPVGRQYRPEIDAILKRYGRR